MMIIGMASEQKKTLLHEKYEKGWREGRADGEAVGKMETTKSIAKNIKKIRNTIGSNR